MKLHPAQKQVVENNNRFKVLLAGRRFGKTVLAVEELIFNAITKSEAKVVYIAPTFQSARDIALEHLIKRIEGISKEINETRLELEVPNKFGNKSKIFLRSWDNIETLRGQAFDFIVLDEVAQYKNFWTGWHEVLRPTLTDRKGHVLFISTPRGYNSFYDLCNLELTDSDYKTFHFTTYDNPYIPVEEIEKAKKELPKERFAQEYMASFQKTAGLVYKEFSRDRHLYDELPKGNYQTIAGVDFGYHQSAVIPIKTDGNNYFVDDEWYKSERTETQLAEFVAASNYSAVYPDPESANGCEELRRLGINVREVVKGKDSVKHGIDKVRELLINGRLKINRKCVNLISEFEMYSYDEDDPTDKPVKENDHALDALRYALTMNDFKPQVIEQQNRRFDSTRYAKQRESTR